MGVVMFFKGMIHRVVASAVMLGLAASLVAATVDPNDNDHENNPDFPTNPDVSYANNLVSISSDAHYAVTSNLDNEIILWDLQKHTHKIISHHANSYSAYFIKHSPYFMSQSLPKNQLKLGTSTGAPPKNMLALVSQNKMGIVSRENKIVYAYYYAPKSGNFAQNIEKKIIPHTINNDFFVNKLPYNQLHADQYSPKFTINSHLTSQLRFIEVLITMGYHSGNIVHVQDPAGHEVLHFDNFPVYGQVMRANLKDYFASSFNWNVYMGYGKKQKLIMLDDGGFYSGKLLNLTLSDSKPYLLTSGSAPDSDDKLVTGKNSVLGNMYHNSNGTYMYSNIHGVTLWNSQTGQPIHKFKDNVFKTYGTLSPDGDYVLAGDENDNIIIWSTKTFKKFFQLWDIFFGKTIAWDKNGVAITDKHGLPPVPTAFHSEHNGSYEEGFNIQFIDATHYLRFPHNIGYAILYNIHDPRPIKYFYLGKTTPAIFDFSQDEALDTSPSKHILVMAMSGQRGGILEYKYDPKTMELKRIWIGHLPLPPSAYGIHEKTKKHASFWQYF